MPVNSSVASNNGLSPPGDSRRAQRTGSVATPARCRTGALNTSIGSKDPLSGVDSCSPLRNAASESRRKAFGSRAYAVSRC